MKREMFKAYLGARPYAGDAKAFFFEGYAHEAPQITALRKAAINGYGPVVRVTRVTSPYTEVWCSLDAACVSQ